MSDYDIKNIPILDDIIEGSDDDQTEVKAIDADKAESDDNNNEASDDNFDLFVDDSTNIEITNLIDTAGPEIGTIEEDIIDNPASNNENDISIDTEQAEPAIPEAASQQKPAIESALVDYLPGEDAADNNETQLNDELDTASLEGIVNDVVKQLLPDLEQQLRFLVKQALEDKLPAEIIEQLPSKPD